MAKQKSPAAHHALLLFASMSEINRQRFIVSMNDFLLASPKYRRQLIEQWKRNHERPTDHDDRSGH